MDPFCFPGNAWVCDRTGKATTTQVEIFAELEKLGWIRRIFTEDKRKERIGFIMLRRAQPECTPAADTPEKVKAAEAALRARVRGNLDTGNPTSRGSVRGQDHHPRCRKPGINDAGNPASRDTGNPGAYLDALEEDAEKDDDDGGFALRETSWSKAFSAKDEPSSSISIDSEPEESPGNQWWHIAGARHVLPFPAPPPPATGLAGEVPRRDGPPGTDPPDATTATSATVVEDSTPDASTSDAPPGPLGGALDQLVARSTASTEPTKGIAKLYALVDERITDPGEREGVKRAIPDMRRRVEGKTKTPNQHIWDAIDRARQNPNREGSIQGFAIGMLKKWVTEGFPQPGHRPKPRKAKGGGPTNQPDPARQAAEKAEAAEKARENAEADAAREARWQRLPDEEKKDIEAAVKRDNPGIYKGVLHPFCLIEMENRDKLQAQTVR
jgi:hypothetical protein